VEAGKVPSVADGAASFQAAVVEVLVTKTVSAARERRAKKVLLSGGVASNSSLREMLIEHSPLSVLVPPPVLCTDNAAMVAACGYYHLRAGRTNGLALDVFPSLKIA
jgi:N6-L-threonylcarbamoyladenine synthase